MADAASERAAGTAARARPEGLSAAAPSPPRARTPPLTALGGAIGDALEHRRLIVLVPFAVIVGILVYLGARFEPAPAASAGLVAAVAGLAIAARRRRALTSLRWLMLALAASVGFALPSVHAAVSGTAMLAVPTAAVIEGVVDDRRQAGEGRQTVFVRLTGSDAAERLDGIRRVRMTVDDAPPMLPGTSVSLRAWLFDVPGAVAPGAYDPQLHSYFAGIGAFGSALEMPALTAPGSGFTHLVAAVRAQIAARIAAHLGPPARAFATALIIGEQGEISEADRAAMARAGLAHVIAISGLHLSLVAGVAFLVLRVLLTVGPLGTRVPAKTVAALAAMAVALGYLFISGAGTATVRATIMLGLVLAAVIAGRRALTMRNVTFAALALVAIDPVGVLRPGFQLSFAAVVALIGCYEGLRWRPDRARRPPVVRYAGALMLTSVIAGIATAPFAAFHFQQFAPLGIVGNLLAVPIVGFVILPAGFVGVLTIPFGLEGPFFAVMGAGIEAMLAIAYWVATLSGPLTTTPEMGAWTLAAVAAGLGWFAFLRKPIRFAGPAVAFALVLAFGWRPAPALIVSDSTQAVAIGTEEGQRLIGSNRTSFAVRAWSERFGVDLTAHEAVGSCDRLGCVARAAGGWEVAVDRSFAAAAEDCGRVAVLVARGGAPAHCRDRGIVITAADLRAGGVHAVRQTTGGLRLEPAFGDLERPWRAGRRD